MTEQNQTVMPAWIVLIEVAQIGHTVQPNDVSPIHYMHTAVKIDSDLIPDFNRGKRAIEVLQEQLV